MIIKQSAENFIVEEIPLKDWDDAGPYSVFRVTKTDLNTEQAMQIISRKFHIPSDTIKYAGTKDRHAVTTQYISIPDRHGLKDIRLDEGNLKLEHVGYSEVPLSLGTLKGNRFIITVRDVTEKEAETLKSKGIGPESRFIIPNYFDDQRFSTNNLSIGVSILKKEYAKAVELLLSDPYYDNTLRTRFEAFPNDHVGMLKRVPKKILQMFIHSVQSYLFNEALSRTLIEYAKSNDIKHYCVDYSLGKLVFYNNPEDYSKTGVGSFELIGFDTRTVSHHIQDVMKNLGLGQRDFIVRAIPELSLDGTDRECFVDVENMKIEVLDARTILEFELSKGAYATMVVKALFN
jgi:tRNA pseudouridine13 synthase